MKRTFITKKKFYDIRRFYKKLSRVNQVLKIGITRDGICKMFDISSSTLTKVLQANNFREYKEMGKIYGKGVKVLRKKYLFILAVIAVVLVLLNLG